MRCDDSLRAWCHLFQVSIHTPTWGVTIKRTFDQMIKDVSIHTPTWGVTSWSNWFINFVIVSIHTPTWGVTKPRQPVRQSLLFQSTHLHEVWQNARSFCLLIIVSIHTPTWGVTSQPEPLYNLYYVSIHTPTWGVTLCWITYYQPASLINYYANRYYFFDFTTQNCSINKLIYWFLTPAKLLFFL